jgi:type I restriction enzyme S subunit
MGAGLLGVGEVPELVRGFEVLAEALDGPEKLRDLVLSLAIRGKLVPQDGREEPASVLLKRVAAELARLGNARRAKLLAAQEASTSELWDDIPSGWAMSNLHDVGVINPRNQAEDDAIVGFVPMAVVPTDYRTALQAEERDWKSIKTGYTHVADGDLVVAKITPCFQNAKSCIVAGLRNGLGAGTTELLVCRPVPHGVDAKFLLIFCKTPEFLSGGVATMTGTAGQQRVALDYFRFRPLPVPPLAEQRRIVARVDELMALIDQFEAARTQREAERTAARDACLAKLCAAANPDEVTTAWSTVASHFDTLFTSPDDIAPLRQSILQLAVRGKLVRQRASEEAASALLARIGGKTTTFPDDSLPPIPVGWATCRFGDLLSRIQAGWSPSCSDRPKEGEEYGVLKVSACSWGKFLADENKALPARSEVPPGIEVRAGDFLISRANTVELVARSVVVGECPDKLLLSDKTLRLTPLQGLNAHFLNLANLGPDSRRHYEAEASGTSASMRNVSQEVIRALPLLLPPKLEQDRIVARVDELMTLCDQLESRVTAARDAAADFASAAVAG